MNTPQRLSSPPKGGAMVSTGYSRLAWRLHTSVDALPCRKAKCKLPVSRRCEISRIFLTDLPQERILDDTRDA